MFRNVSGRARVVIGPLGRRLAAALIDLGAQPRATFARYLDGGYHPDAITAIASEPGDAGIEVKELSVGYGERMALEGVTGRFAPSSLTAIIGPNGAGKSTLLKSIAGILKPQAGDVKCPALAAHRLAYLPQQAELNREFPITVGELVALGGWRGFGAFRRPPEELPGRIAEAAAAAGVGGLMERPIADLSAGEFQRALFARLLLQDAAVILLDEPFAAVDERTTEDLLTLVARWHREGRTVVAVLHDLDQVRDHFPCALLLARSCIDWGDTGTVLTKDNLARARQVLEASSKPSAVS